MLGIIAYVGSPDILSYLLLCLDQPAKILITNVQGEYIVACQAHPALVKIGLVLARIFHFNSLLVCIHLV